MPIDQSGKSRDDIQGIKDGIGAGPKDWVGSTPDGHVITTDPNGNADDHGSADDYVHRTSHAEQRARSAIPGWVWGLIGAAAALAIVARFASGVCEFAALVGLMGASMLRSEVSSTTNMMSGGANTTFDPSRPSFA